MKCGVAVLTLSLAAVGALADSKDLTLYGTLNLSMDAIDGSDGVLSNNLVSSNSSNFGLKGAEEISPGLKAIFQIESGVSMDVGGGVFASRNSHVGLQGDYGTLFFGNWDSPYKQGRLDPWGNSGVLASYTDIMGGNASGTFGNTNASRQAFDRRISNVIQYWSPPINNFFIKLAYGAGEEKTAMQSPSLAAISVGYDTGQLYLAYAREQHTQFAGSSSRDFGNRIAASYKYKGATFCFVGEQLKWSGAVTPSLAKGNSVGASSSIEKTAAFFSYIQPFGVVELRLSYGFDNGVRLDNGTIPESRAKQLGVGVGYSFSKTTEGFFLYSTVRNEKNSNNTFIGKSLNGAGQNVAGLSLGLKKFF